MGWFDGTRCAGCRIWVPVAVVLVVLLASRTAALDIPLIFTQESVTGGLPESRLVMLSPGGEVTVLTPGFAAAADPNVSFCGTQVLFAGRIRAEDPWNIWVMDVDGSHQRQVTRDMGDCREPIFLARAPVDAPDFVDNVRWIAFTSTATRALDQHGRYPLTNLYAINLVPLAARGTVLWRTSYNLGNDITPTILADGRMLYSSWQRDAYALMFSTWAGEGINQFFGTDTGGWSQLSPFEVRADRRVVFIERKGYSEDRSGRLAQVSMRRPLASHQVLSRDDGGLYRTPHALPDGRLLVSYAREGDRYGIYHFDERRGRPGRRVYDAPEWHDVDPQLVVERAEPVGRIPMVEFASVVDISGFEGAAQLQCLNVYDSDRPEVAAIPHGAVKSVRLVEGMSMTPAEARRSGLQPGVDYANDTWPPPFVRTRSLGVAPVESDGSFYVNVPGNVPFYVQLLDEHGDELHTMRAWAWVRSGDQRSCIGCHEDKELAPVNRATKALIKADPMNLMGPRANIEGAD